MLKVAALAMCIHSDAHASAPTETGLHTRITKKTVDGRLISVHSLHVRCHVRHVAIRAGAPVPSPYDYHNQEG